VYRTGIYTIVTGHCPKVIPAKIQSRLPPSQGRIQLTQRSHFRGGQRPSFHRKQKHHWDRASKSEMEGEKCSHGDGNFADFTGARGVIVQHFPMEMLKHGAVLQHSTQYFFSANFSDLKDPLVATS
jgi:hypothetical protein